MRVDLFTLVSSLLLGATVVGCDAVNDYIPATNGKAAAQERERRSQERETAAERERADGEREALRLHIEAHCRTLESALAANKERRAEVKADRETLSARIREISLSSDEKGRTPERHVVLSGLLADDRVNELAVRYVERDFRMIRLEFIEAMRVTNGLAKRRDDALVRNQNAYDKSVSGISDDADKARQMAQKSADDLQRSIAALERKEKELQRSVSMSSGVRNVRMRKEQELRDVSNRLRELHARYDAIRTNRESNDAVERATRQASRTMADAQLAKERADALVARNFAGMKDPAEITSDCEQRTVGELERRIIAAARDLEEGQKGSAEILGYLKSIVVGLDKMNLPALQRVRSDVDARLAKKSGSR